MPAQSHGPPQLAPHTPGDLRRLLNFVNSRPVLEWPDGLDEASGAQAFLVRSGFDLDGATASEADLARLRELRGALVILLDPGRDGATVTTAWGVLDTLALRAPVSIAFAAGPSTALRPAGEDGQRVLAELLADVHMAILDGRWGRLRLCAYEPCAVAFYDATRSRSQRWHSYKACGNRVNVAAHRAHKRT
jgi:predicted RNA-binding Zn ribbon-like protein